MTRAQAQQLGEKLAVLCPNLQDLNLAGGCQGCAQGSARGSARATSPNNNTVMAMVWVAGLWAQPRSLQIRRAGSPKIKSRACM